MSEAAQAPAPAPAANPNKLIFIMMGAMFFLVVAGMGGMFFMMKGKSSDQPAQSASAESGKEAAKQGEEVKEKAPAKYVSFEPPFVVNFKADSAVKFLQVSLQVMTRDSVMERVLKENDPAIRNAILSLLDGQTYEVLSTAEGKEELRKNALEKVRGVMKEEGADPTKVEAVYFTAFVMQ
jgi:flagellar FliL protein